MNCMEENKNSGCCCALSNNSSFFSKKKKIEVLKHYLECIEEKRDDLKQAINELNEK